jgi:hypothetical protein
MTTLNARGDPVRHAGRDAEEIDGHEDGCAIISYLKGERLRMEWKRNAL